MGVPQSDGRVVMAQSMYPKEGNPLWEKYSTKAVAHTLKWYSYYTFDYPYPFDLGHGDIIIIRTVKPAVPKPVEIYTGCLFHGAEKISRVGLFKCPSTGILFKCHIKKFTTHDGR